MYEEGEANDARHFELDSAEEIRCNVLLQSARYLQGVRCYHDRNVQQHFSMLEIWSIIASRTKSSCTSLIRDGREPSSCTRLQDEDRIAYGTLMARRSQTPEILSTYAIFTLS
jgi:hypothetical protein